MAIPLTADPIVTLQEAKDILGMNDEPKTTVLINSVSEKFRKFTNRVTINEQPIDENLNAYDSRVVWVHGSPINSVSDVTVSPLLPDGSTGTPLSAQAGELVIDYVKGRIIRPDCEPFDSVCGFCVLGGGDVKFPNLLVSYTGGWDIVPGDVQMAAFEQMMIDNERLKGAIAMTVGTTLDGQFALNSEGLLQTVADVWKAYRVIV